MDKDQETLDILDIPNTISLNPFDRPPNPMDEDLNSVTQEELEANLSTDCPTGAMDMTPAQNCNDMWEKLIQSVLEDNSTQDAVVHSDANLFDEVQTLVKEEEKEMVDDIKIEESLNEVLAENPEQTIPEIQKEEEEINKHEEPLTEIKPEDQNEPDNIEDKTMLEVTIEKEEMQEAVMDFCKAEEQMLSPCMYDMNNDDENDSICQVEVYATNHENDSKQLEDDDIRKSFYEDDDDDCFSGISTNSVGYLEPNDKKLECKLEPKEEESCKETQLSTIINDHCYSQEVSINAAECDVLKQNVINHIMNQNISNKDPQKISKLVDKILNNLDNNKLDIILKTLNINESPVEEQQDESHFKIENESVSNNTNEELGDKVTDGEAETQHLENLQEHTQDLEEKSFENVSEAEKTINESLLENTDEEANPETSENFESEEVSIKETEKSTEIEQNEKSDDTEKDSSASKEIINDTSNEENPPNEIESVETKSQNTIGNLPYNCSETIENQIFDEDFEQLCKNGTLPKKPDITNEYYKLLEKLKDFATQIHKDCELYAVSSIESKLHDYIKLQYYNFQEIFKHHVILTETTAVQTEETNINKVSKRKRKKAKKSPNKNNTSETRYSSSSSSTYSKSSSSSDDEEVEENNTAKQKSTCIKEDEQDRCSASDIKSLPSFVEHYKNNIVNYNHEYDDGINLSQYVQSEIFTIDSPLQYDDSECDSGKDDNDMDENLQKDDDNFDNIDNGDEDTDEKSDSDDNSLIFKIRTKKSKPLNDTSSVVSPADDKKSNKIQTDNMSVHSESDKENLTSERKERKSNESMDEDEKNDREIDR